jgi:predicted NUDIX family phosphoesterase
MVHRANANDSQGILAVSRNVFKNFKCLKAFSTNVSILPAIISKAFFINRFLIENDESYKQLIPYVVLMHQKEIVTYTRYKGAEPRLRNMASFGFGGHVIKNDLGEDSLANINTLWNAAKREIIEEIGVVPHVPNDPSALINEDTTPVGRVHFGIVYLTEVGKEIYKSSLATEHANFRLVSLKELHLIQNLEPWSKIIAENLICKRI